MAKESNTEDACRTQSYKRKALPPPGGFQRLPGEPDGRCPYCSFMPTSASDFCSTHKVGA